METGPSRHPEEEPVRSAHRQTLVVFATLALAAGAMWPTLAAQSEPTVAIVGATVIDGNGGEPLANATVLVVGARIKAVGPRSTIQVPQGAQVIDGTGKFVTPGFIDSNV